MLFNFITLGFGVMCIIFPIIKKWRGNDRFALIFMGAIFIILSIIKWNDW